MLIKIMVINKKIKQVFNNLNQLLYTIYKN
jgi:hypothetical protein